MKRIVFALLALTLLISMASCAETAKETETKTEEIATETQEAEEITTEEAEQQLRDMVSLAKDFLGVPSEKVFEQMTAVLDRHGGAELYMWDNPICMMTYKVYHSVGNQTECEVYIQEAEKLLGLTV